MEFGTKQDNQISNDFELPLLELGSWCGVRSDSENGIGKSSQSNSSENLTY